MSRTAAYKISNATIESYVDVASRGVVVLGFGEPIEVAFASADGAACVAKLSRPEAMALSREISRRARMKRSGGQVEQA